MDRTTLLFALALVAAVAGTVLVSLYEDPRLAELNRALARDPLVSGYAYRFRVVAVDGDTAVLSTPRSPQVPVAQVLGILSPSAAGQAPESQAFQAAQEELATVQKRALAIVLEHPDIDDARWELDRGWLAARRLPVPQAVN